MQTLQRAHEVDAMPATALFWGTRDPIIPLRHSKAIRQAFTGVTLTTYKGCGHYPHLDNPEPFAKDLIGFLSDPHRSPARLRPARQKKGLGDLLPGLHSRREQNEASLP